MSTAVVSDLPPPPPGLPATIVSTRAVPAAQRIGVAAGLAVAFFAFAAFMVWRGLSWGVSLGIFGFGYAVILWAAFATSLNAGDGWVRSGMRRYVRTDRLVSLRTRTTLSGTFVTMHDGDGRKLEVRLSDLMADARLWDVVRRGVGASLGAGLTVDEATRQIFV